MLSKKMTVLLILVLYLLFNLYMGIRVSRKSARENAGKGFMSNYFAGSRSMGGVVLAMTLVATYTSASSFLGGPGLASSFGMTWSWVAGVQIGATFLTLGVLGKKFAMISRRTNSVTINDYLRARYNSPAVVIVCGTDSHGSSLLGRSASVRSRGNTVYICRRFQSCSND